MTYFLKILFQCEIFGGAAQPEDSILHMQKSESLVLYREIVGLCKDLDSRGDGGQGPALIDTPGLGNNPVNITV